MKPHVCIVGTGYVGMACLIGFAELGFTVTGYDILPDRIERLKAGIAPYREAGLEALLRRSIDAGRLSFHTSIEAAAKDASVIVIAVGTPAREDGSADISALHVAVNELSKIDFETPPTVVLRSTIPPGTSDRFAEMVESWASLVYAPEFLREGSAVHDFLHPDRIVVGAATTESAVAYIRLFESIGRPVVITSRCNAELIKCCSNAFLALKISYANEVANLCDALGGTADDVLRGIGYDRRIGSEFLQPGIGFGGPCFEKDVRSLEHIASGLNSSSELYSATLRVNEAQPRRIISILESEVGNLAGRHIGVWGLAFKSGTDDIRDSLALRIVESLSACGATTSVYDPAVHVAPLPQGSRLVSTALEAAEADALLVLTDWPEFSLINPMTFANTLRLGVVVDGRNALESARVAAAGLRYRGVGRVSYGDRVTTTAATA